MHKISVFILCLAATIAVPAIALAKVPAQGSTRAAILQAAADPTSSTARCFEVELATRGSNWAFVDNPRSAAHTAACRGLQLGGYTFLHRARGRWTSVSSGDELGCPIRSSPHQPTIPSTIVRELTGLRCRR